MSFSSNANIVAPIMRSLLVNGTRACVRQATVAGLNSTASLNNRSFATSTQQILSVAKPTIGASALLANRLAIQSLHTTTIRRGIDSSTAPSDETPASLPEILEREINEELAELNKNLASDQFPGFSVETEDADVTLTKQIGDSNVTVRFTVSSSLSEWQSERQENDQDSQQSQQPDMTNFALLSLPEFQVQISRNGRTLEISCYFEEMDQDEETGEQYSVDPVFNVDELVMYEGEPKSTEFAVSAEYFRSDLQDGILQYLADHGIDDEFAKNLVAFATNYEKKQYIGLMKRLKDFVSK